jgi:hypothetical protein
MAKNIEIYTSGIADIPQRTLVNNFGAVHAEGQKVSDLKKTLLEKFKDANAIINLRIAPARDTYMSSTNVYFGDAVQLQDVK